MRSYPKILDRYAFSFPPSLIAQQLAHPRDSARLLVYDRVTKKVRFSTFEHLATFLPKDALLVFNETKVVPARLTVRKKTGGKVDLLYISTEKRLVKVLANRKLIIGQELFLGPRSSFIVSSSDGRFYYVRPSFGIRRLHEILKKYGTAPLPPYIKHPVGSRTVLLKEYQTIFAKQAGSVAAPTASLHFTKRLMTSLQKRGISIRFVTLHVGLGTFAPVTDTQLRSGSLHSERYSIDLTTAKAIVAARRQGKPIIAVGTTVVRTLESAFDARGRARHLRGDTDLFIREGYRFNVIDGLITNFHVPRSSLLMLVSAFAGREQTLELYRKAIRQKFRLFSFGDGMLIR